MKQVEQTIYLGGIIDQKGNAALEINNRIKKAMTTVTALKTFWNKTSCSRKWKALVYNACVISQLIYGLETIPLTDGLINKLDAFQMKGFRKIVQIDHTYYSRVSNKTVMDTLNRNIGER